jgi:hypothetical protein
MMREIVCIIAQEIPAAILIYQYVLLSADFLFLEPLSFALE